MMMVPVIGSIILNNASSNWSDSHEIVGLHRWNILTEDFPAPVLPQMPIFSLGSCCIEVNFGTAI